MSQSRHHVREAAAAPGWLGLREHLGRPRVAGDGEVLLQRGHGVTEVLVIISGAVEVFQQSAEGLAKVFRILVGPTAVGAVEVLGGEQVYLASVRSLGNLVYHRLTPDELWSLLRAQPSLAMAMLADTSGVVCAGSRYANAALSDTETLLANLLVAYAELHGEQVAEGMRVGLRRSQAQLALAIGAAERSVNRILARWRRAEWIRKRSGAYVLLDLPALQALAEPLRGSLIHRGEHAGARTAARR